MSKLSQTLDEIYAQLDASLPKPIQPDEFSVAMYRAAHPGMTPGQAKARIALLLEQKKIERLPEKRMVEGSVCFVYHLLHKPA